MKTLLLLSYLVISSFQTEEKPVEIKLWDKVPTENGINEQKEKGPLYVEEPFLTVYPAKNPNGQAIIACPGGAYWNLAADHEGHDMAAWFNKQGITYAVLVYRMPNGHSSIPLEDATQAMKIMKENSKRWGIKHIGIMGSSAGGHLASTLATHTKGELCPDFQILFYPVITMEKDFTHMGSRNHLLGNNPTEEMVDKFSNEKQVTADTPPAFIMHCTDDDLVPVENSLQYYMALKKNGVSATLHIYDRGGHGWGYQDKFYYKEQWTEELKNWLRYLSF